MTLEAAILITCLATPPGDYNGDGQVDHNDVIWLVENLQIPNNDTGYEEVMDLVEELAPCDPHNWVTPPILPADPENFCEPETLQDLQDAVDTDKTHITLSLFIDGIATVRGDDITIESLSSVGVSALKLNSAAERIHILGGRVDYIWGEHDTSTPTDVLVEDVTMYPSFRYGVRPNKSTRFELRRVTIHAFTPPTADCGTYGIWGGEGVTDMKVGDCVITAYHYANPNECESTVRFHTADGLHIVGTYIQNHCKHTLRVHDNSSDVLIESCIFRGGGTWFGSEVQGASEPQTFLILCCRWEHENTDLLKLWDIEECLFQQNVLNSTVPDASIGRANLSNYRFFRNRFNGTPITDEESGNPPNP